MNTIPTFAIIGVAGYIAPKHLQAIKSIGGNLIAAIDPNDNVERLDDYFPDCEYFKQRENFEQYIHSNPVDYITICSPTHLHFAHIMMALKSGCHVICESPLVLSTNELDEIIEAEKRTGKKAYTLLQYRYHPEVLKLKQQNDNGEKHTIQLINHTYRGKWFSKSWKGNAQQSGGILTSLGYHFFDFLIWIYGEPQNMKITQQNESEVTGELKLTNASINFSFKNASEENKTNKQRELVVNGKNVDLSLDTNDVFEKCYADILECKSDSISSLNTLIEILEK